MSDYKLVKTILNNCLQEVRPDFPGRPDLEILAVILRDGQKAFGPEVLKDFARTKKRFSTADVMQAYVVDKYQVAAALAVLRQAEEVEPASPAKDKFGFSRWVWRG